MKPIQLHVVGIIAFIILTVLGVIAMFTHSKILIGVVIVGMPIALIIWLVGVLLKRRQRKAGTTSPVEKPKKL